MTRKELIILAMQRAMETADICKQNPLPNDATDEQKKTWRAIDQTREHAKGMQDAFSAVWDAMNGNTHMLKYYADKL